MIESWQSTGRVGAGSVTHLAELNSEDGVATLIAASLAGLHTSVDGGASWSTSGMGQVGPYIRDMAISPLGVVAVSTPDGIFISNDKCKTWSVAKPTWSPGAVVFVGDDRLLSSSNASGELYSVSLESGLSELIAELPEAVVRFVVTSSGIYAATSTLFLSEDSGQSWSEISLNTGGRVEDIVSLSPDSILVLTPGELLEVDALGVESVSPETPFPIACAAESSDGKVIVAGFQGGISVSLDRGGRWHKQQIDGVPLSLLVSNGGQQIIVGMEGRGLSISGNGGDTWQSPLLEDSALVVDIAVEPFGQRITLAEGIVRETGSSDRSKAIELDDRLIQHPNPPFDANDIVDVASGANDGSLAIACRNPDGVCSVWLHLPNQEWRRIITHPEASQTISLTMINGHRTLFAAVGDSVYRPSRIGSFLFSREIVDPERRLQLLFIDGCQMKPDEIVLVTMTSHGLYRSLDEGLSWESVRSPGGPPITAFSIDDSIEPPAIVAAQLGGSMYVIPLHSVSH